ncbi:hypothetical protein GUJ93_ZPchr0003g17138 [Zizania palustris]|uniref:non-specific serine/threonine protein kinase n=1 Tax=Zizania palustris TaxID=103762 RepID=A0A8J5SLV7_ZIZPA|nr:hypothetical protein GUJ93_ZPchr0003g17138 [Zizania palustris]
MAASLVSLTVSLLIFLHGAPVAVVTTDAATAQLPRSELAAIFRVMADLLGDPTWPQLHPRPCTDTPWPGLQCEIAPDDGRRLRATRLAGCTSAPICFVDDQAAAVELPPALFTNSSSLEQLVLKSNPGLTGVIPAMLSELRSLRVLSLSQNGFRGEIPPELGRLAALQQLDLSYNNLTGEVGVYMLFRRQIPEEIGGMASLSILDLSWNSIAGGVPVALGRLNLLEKADLSYNRLAGRVPPGVGSLRELVFLDLSHNELAGPLPASMAGLGKLQYLLLQDNPIGTAVPAAVVGSLRRLQVLGLSGCNLTGPIPRGAFAALGRLTALSLDRNRLDGPIPASLAALPHLGQLNLSQNRLAGEIALPTEFVERLGRRLDVRGNDELCVGRDRYGGVQASYLGAPPCVTAEGGDGSIGAGTSSSVEGSTGGAATTGRGFRVYEVVGMFGGLVCHIALLLVFYL